MILQSLLACLFIFSAQNLVVFLRKKYNVKGLKHFDAVYFTNLSRSIAVGFFAVDYYYAIDDSMINITCTRLVIITH